MTNKPKNKISQLVAKSIAKNSCETHGQPITHICLHNHLLGCVDCKFDLSMQVGEAVEDPIKMAMAYNKAVGEARQHLRSLDEADQHNKIKAGFEALVEEIRNVVNLHCARISQTFNSRWAEAHQSSACNLQQIKQAQTHYRRAFEQLLQNQFSEGTPEQLSHLISQFCSQCSEDPSDYVSSRFGSIVEGWGNMPLVDWDSLKNIYLHVAEPTIWSSNQVLRSSFNTRKQEGRNLGQKVQEICVEPSVLVPEILNRLKDSRFCLKFNNKAVSLMQNQQNQPMVQVSAVEGKFDTFYQMDRFQLLGINYEGIKQFSYAFGQLQLLRTYSIKACANVLLFPHCFILEAENRIIRLWLSDNHREVVSLNGSCLEAAARPYHFCFTNAKGEKMEHPAFHPKT